MNPEECATRLSAQWLGRMVRVTVDDDRIATGKLLGYTVNAKIDGIKRTVTGELTLDIGTIVVTEEARVITSVW